MLYQLIILSFGFLLILNEYLRLISQKSPFLPYSYYEQKNPFLINFFCCITSK